jgi:hypothetical protein
MGYLFQNLDDYPSANRGIQTRASPLRNRTRPPLQIEADASVIALFRDLQRLWRRQGTLRTTFEGMPSSREERRDWERLIQYLTKSDAGRNSAGQ